jgi:aminopeptidase
MTACGKFPVDDDRLPPTETQPARNLTLDPADRLERYADLIVRVGANVQPGQDVYLVANVAHVPIARAIAERAYAIGAGRVVIEYTDEHVRRSAIVHAEEEALRSTYRYELERIREFRDRQAALVFLTGNPEPHLFDGLDPKRVAARRPEMDQAANDVIFSGDVAWTVVPAPNAGWATQVFGEPDLERLWNAVAVAIRLDQPDPVGAWRDHLAVLRARRDAVDALDLDSVHFRGPGTDLVVKLIARSNWVTGSVVSNRGVDYVPNVPTEEVFTSPDWRLTEGTARVTAPVVLGGGSLVQGLRLRFEGGRIVDVQADQGADLVRAQIEEDEQACYLGEVALVDGSSAVARAGVVFHDTLFDENANSHIAWGRGFEEALPGSAELDPEARLATGLNQSRIHTDVVIGGPDVDVDGVARDGRVMPLMRADRWVLELA